MFLKCVVQSRHDELDEFDAVDTKARLYSTQASYVF